MDDPRQQDLPNKPDWDRSLSGLHPALRDLTVSEEELKAAMAAAPAGLASPDEKMRAHALACVESYAANLKYFASPQYSKDDKPEKVRFYRVALAAALGDAGRFDEAVAVLTHNEQPLPGCEVAVNTIVRAAEAIDRPDDEECDCPRETAEVDIDPDKPERGTHAITLNRRVELGKIYSEKHGKMVSHWRCRHCGHENAHDRIPERQVKIHRHRADIDQIVRAAIAGGTGVTARNWVPNPALSDANLLKDDQ